MRDRLIELLKVCLNDETIETDDGYVGFNVAYGKIADHLIANGVTVQEWISVKDRLPGKGQNVLCCSNTKRDEPFIGYRDDYTGDWCEDGWDCDWRKITHWMPLPPTPEGE